MGSPIAIASALAQMATIRCPWCGHKKLVSRKPAAFRVCPRCKKHFPDPFAKRK